MNSTLVGIILGVMLASILRHIKIRRLRQDYIDRYYKLRSRNYDVIELLFFGFSPRHRLRQELTQMAALKEGLWVLDIGCGTGSNFPYILPKIGESGYLLGLDINKDMLERASHRISISGWKNVEITEAETATTKITEYFDVVVCCLSLQCIPNYIGTLENAWESLKPGGLLVVADRRLSSRWYLAPFGFLADIIDIIACSDSTRRPWEWMSKRGTEFEYREIHMGSYYVASTRKSN